MFFDWGTPIRHFGYLLGGAANTLWITLVAFVLSFSFGALLAVARYHRKARLTYIPATVYVELIRNTPVLVQIFLVYFGLPEFNIRLTPVVAGIVALAINNSAYLAEILRAGLQSIQKGQWEAAASLGLGGRQTLWWVIFPQSIRNVFPAIANQFIAIIFGTSLLSVLDVRELTDRAAILNSETFRTMEIFVFVTLMYYAISFILSMASKWINRTFFPSVTR